jgi:hypothetical protein
VAVPVNGLGETAGDSSTSLGMTAVSFRASAAPRRHSERAQRPAVIPSERSESRNRDRPNRVVHRSGRA